MRYSVTRLLGRNTLKYQPAKLAAIEAHWNRQSHAPLTLFAIPDSRTESNRFAVEIPEIGSLILTHDRQGVVPGLKDTPREDRPPVAVPFFAFRLMVGIGLLMLAIIAVGCSRWTQHAGLLAGGVSIPAAGHFDVYVLVLLGVSRQGARGYRLLTGAMRTGFA